MKKIMKEVREKANALESMTRGRVDYQDDGVAVVMEWNDRDDGLAIDRLRD